MPFKLAARLPGLQYVGPHRYFVTICVKGRAPVFIIHTAVDGVLTQFRNTAENAGFAVIAYCFMPDHLHALLEGTTAAANFREFIRVFKQRSAFCWKQAYGRELWQRSYFEHVLRNDEDTITVARYILANPVRASLVESPADYPFLGSLTLSVEDLFDSVRRT